MYKKAMGALLMMNLMFLFSFICVAGIEEVRAVVIPASEMKIDETLLADAQYSTLGIAAVATSGQRVVGFGTLEKELKYNLPATELEVLCRIVEAEAGTEDEEGKLLVANVVLNRMDNEAFPDTVSEVVFQRSNGVTQFSPVSNGRYYCVQISEATYAAVQRALEGDNISEGALYFAARKYADSERMRWFDENLIFLFKHGGHEFFK